MFYVFICLQLLMLKHIFIKALKFLVKLQSCSVSLFGYIFYVKKYLSVFYFAKLILYVHVFFFSFYVLKICLCSYFTKFVFYVWILILLFVCVLQILKYKLVCHCFSGKERTDIAHSSFVYRGRCYEPS